MSWQRLAPGIEPVYASPQTSTEQQLTTPAEEVSAQCLHGSGNACHFLASLDQALIRLIELWSSLSPDTRKTIHAICVDAVAPGNQQSKRQKMSVNLSVDRNDDFGEVCPT